MQTITLQLPHMYGDHHVIAVRELLLGLDGVNDVYASSSFQIAQVTFDEDVITQDRIQEMLGEAGYLGEMPILVEIGTDKREDAIFRHTASFAQTGTVTFRQEVTSSGKALWPCPGMKQNKFVAEEETHGTER